MQNQPGADFCNFRHLDAWVTARHLCLQVSFSKNCNSGFLPSEILLTFALRYWWCTQLTVTKVLFPLVSGPNTSGQITLKEWFNLKKPTEKFVSAYTGLLKLSHTHLLPQNFGFCWCLSWNGRVIHNSPAFSLLPLKKARSGIQVDCVLYLTKPLVKPHPTCHPHPRCPRWPKTRFITSRSVAALTDNWRKGKMKILNFLGASFQLKGTQWMPIKRHSECATSPFCTREATKRALLHPPQLLMCGEQWNQRVFLFSTHSQKHVLKSKFRQRKIFSNCKPFSHSRTVVISVHLWNLSLQLRLVSHPLIQWMQQCWFVGSNKLYVVLRNSSINQACNKISCWKGAHLGHYEQVFLLSGHQPLTYCRVPWMLPLFLRTLSAIKTFVMRRQSKWFISFILNPIFSLSDALRFWVFHGVHRARSITFWGITESRSSYLADSEHSGEDNGMMHVNFDYFLAKS